ncbi:MAG: 3-dehydroquinate dehydratase [Firmicutes bacterium]|nr:3-dehydroquinate dehydratase [Bacillota bacterium]
MKIKIISGANLNILERRGSEYGNISYNELVNKIKEFAKEINSKIKLEFFISNYEGEIIEELHNNDADALIINAGAYSHYSLAIADAIKSLTVSIIEVHLTNIHSTGRHISITGAVCDGVISGFGIYGYKLAIQQLLNKK